LVDNHGNTNIQKESKKISQKDEKKTRKRYSKKIGIVPFKDETGLNELT